ncbi:hypothetical protein VP1G_08511 [Cytospora mali]|uniref:Uncharacterized protein n=1 Tax=Cytospora mali TaxID=578113 RepID=A0A194VBP8_CYTMA|nr:hypothetical protein VP1G_08511 [Valsa mali var. pyri (nom. inval.)]
MSTLSQQSTDSGSTTQPNTPRIPDAQTIQSQAEAGREIAEGNGEEADEAPGQEQYEDDDQDGSCGGHSNNDAHIPSSTSSSLTSTRVRVNMQSQAPLEMSKFDLKKARALAEWDDDVGDGDRRARTDPALISNLFADIHWTPRDGKAFFRVRTSFQTNPSPGERRTRESAPRHGSVQAFFFIYPERIRHLSVELQPDVMRLGVDTVALRFKLSRQGVLVLPPDLPDTELSNTGRGTLQDLRSLAARLDFVLHAKIRRLHISGHRLQQLSTAVSRGEVTTIRSLANTTSLYRGRGGRAVEGRDLEEAAAATAANTSHPGQGVVSSPAIDDDDDDDREGGLDEDAVCNERPPAYEEAGPSDARGKKRRRGSSTSIKDKDVDTVAVGLPNVRELCELLPSSIAKPLMDILAAQQSMFTQQFAAQEQRLDQLLRTTNELRAKITDLTREVDRQPDYIDNTVDRRLEEGLEETREAIMRSLTRGSMRATLYFDSPNRD